jgi:hypothetical protein
MSARNEENMDKPKVKFKYLFDENYNPAYANGVYGGVSTKGEINLNFFLERLALPNTQEFELDTDTGQLINKPTNAPDDFNYSVIRFIQSGVVLNLDDAMTIHKWLGDRIDELKKRMDGE